MILLLIEYLRDHFSYLLPSVFIYTSTRMLLAALTALSISIFLGPRFIAFLSSWKIKQAIRTDDCKKLSELHDVKKNTPTMGGVLILSSMLISMVLWMDLKHIYSLWLFITTITLGVLGGFDDSLKLKYRNAKGLSGRYKMGVQILLGLILGCYLYSSDFQKGMQMGSWWAPPVAKEWIEGSLHTIPLNQLLERLYIPFCKFPLMLTGEWGIFLSFGLLLGAVVGSSNAVNLTDGLDGLAAGSVIFVAGCLAVISFVSNNLDLAGYLNILYLEGSGEIAVYMSAMVGACLGFLWYNSYPAEVFMGDTGSLALGGVLGVSAVLLKRELLLALIGGIFVSEALSVLLQVASFKLYRKRIFLCAPLHHHFEYKGWPETKVVIRFWIIGFLLALLGLISLKFQ